MENMLEKIYEAGLKFLVPLTPEETYQIIVKEAIKLVKVDYGSIFLEKHGVFERVYPYSKTSYEMKARKGFISKTFKSGVPIISDINTIGNIYPHIKEMGIKSIISVPLSYLSKTVGVLTVQSINRNYFDEDALNALKLFSPLASLAIRKTQLYSEARGALKIRDLFIAMAAHELRTPLTTINGYVQLLQTKLPKIKPPMSRWIKELSWETTRLTLLVNELLEVSRINTGQLQYVFCEHNLIEIIERALLDFKFSHSNHKLVFENQVGRNKALVVGDFDKLLQVVINLLDNAAKFSPPDTGITIELKSRNPYHILSIKDQGNGITKQDLPKIFDGFFKVDENSASGLGLGLFLCKKIIEEHHGSIKIRSKINQGTKVEVYLPMIKTKKEQ